MRYLLRRLGMPRVLQAFEAEWCAFQRPSPLSTPLLPGRLCLIWLTGVARGLQAHIAAKSSSSKSCCS